MKTIQQPSYKTLFIITIFIISAVFLGCSVGSGGGNGGGTGTNAPEMDITWEGTDVPDGAQNYDLGAVQVDQETDFTFTVKNSGTLDLNFTGAPARVVLVDDDPAASPAITLADDIGASLAAGNVSDFKVHIDAAGAALGTYTGSVSIANDDSDENPYDFTFRVTVAAQAPEINVKQGTTDIPNSTLFDFGNVQTGASATKTFTIENLGLLALNLTGEPQRVSLSGDTQFTLELDAATPVASLGSTSFEIKYTPTAAETNIATVSIASDDSDENPYTFTISATGAAPAPEINIKQGAADIANGTGSYDFGTVMVGSPANVTLTIENSGMLELNLSGTSSHVQLSGDLQFTLETDAVSPVAASGESTFVISYTPTAAQSNSATVSIASDDSDENPYTFTLTGQGLAAPPVINGISSGTYNTDQAFMMTGIDAGSTAYYSLNNGTDWTEYSGEVTLSAEGSYRVVAKQVGADLQESAVSSPSIDIVIDKTAPAPPAGLDLAAADDTGDSASDNITKNTGGLTISGTAEAEAAVQLFSDIDGDVGGTTADGSGNWSVDITLTENIHSITAVATDAAGNSSGASDPLSLTVDTTPPAAPSKPDLAAEDDSNINNDNITNHYQNLSFSGTADAGVKVILSSSLEGELGTVNADGSGNWSFDPVDLVNNNNTHSITATAVDQAGNEAASPALSLVIDTIAPAFREDKFAAGDRVVVTDAANAGNFTAESGVTATWDSASKQVELMDVAGNTNTRDMVYQGAETDGLRTAVETDAAAGDVIYIMAGQYDIDSELNIGVDLTVKGEGPSTFINQQTQSSDATLYLAASNITVYVEGLKLDNQNANTIRAGFNTVDVYLKNITKGPNASQYLVTVIGHAYYWVSGSGYVQAQDGADGWTYYFNYFWRFQGANDTTYWAE